jgi:hypothetical protein
MTALVNELRILVGSIFLTGLSVEDSLGTGLRKAMAILRIDSSEAIKQI